MNSSLWQNSTRSSSSPWMPFLLFQLMIILKIVMTTFSNWSSLFFQVQTNTSNSHNLQLVLLFTSTSELLCIENDQYWSWWCKYLKWMAKNIKSIFSAPKWSWNLEQCIPPREIPLELINSCTLKIQWKKILHNKYWRCIH